MFALVRGKRLGGHFFGTHCIISRPY